MPGSKRVTLVGAGPVGSLLSVYLARRGFEVEMYERRPDMRREAVEAGRSINLAVSTRGIHALKELGLDTEALTQAIPMRGRMIHPVQGELAFQPYGMDETQAIHSISRGGLNCFLMTAAERTGKVKIHFNERAVGAEWNPLRLRFRNERTGRESEVAAEPVIGTDGSASCLREAMMALPERTCSQAPLDYGYKELTIPAGPRGAFRMEKNALHIWPRGTFMLIALPNFDGSYTCTLFLPHLGATSFDTLRTPAAVDEFFSRQFPDARPLITELAETFFANPTGHMVTVKCAPWNVDGQALLLGDAAHAIVPFFGQGMNCGFEDCTILNEMLGAPGAELPWTRLFPAFSSARKRDSDAIADMAVENFTEMRDKVGNQRFLLQKAVEKILQARFPGKYLSRYALVTFDRVPYRLAFDAGVIGDGILDELCAKLEKPEQVDLARAEVLIRQRLAPLLEGRTAG